MIVPAGEEDESDFHVSFKLTTTSPEYTEIAEDRKAGADAVVLLIKGF